MLSLRHLDVLRPSLVIVRRLLVRVLLLLLLSLGLADVTFVAWRVLLKHEQVLSEPVEVLEKQLIVLDFELYPQDELLVLTLEVVCLK